MPAKECLQIIFELYEWELTQLPFIDSVVGRHVYVCIARKVLSDSLNPASAISLKALLSTNHLTDRAIRLKLREMESAGYISTVHGRHDKRARILLPTQKLLDLIREHSLMASRSLSTDFHMVSKYD